MLTPACSVPGLLLDKVALFVSSTLILRVFNLHIQRFLQLHFSFVLRFRFPFSWTLMEDSFAFLLVLALTCRSCRSRITGIRNLSLQLLDVKSKSHGGAFYTC